MFDAATEPRLPECPTTTATPESTSQSAYSMAEGASCTLRVESATRSIGASPRSASASRTAGYQPASSAMPTRARGASGTQDSAGKAARRSEAKTRIQLLRTAGTAPESS
jgi:hypothetical protein